MLVCKQTLTENVQLVNLSGENATIERHKGCYISLVYLVQSFVCFSFNPLFAFPLNLYNNIRQCYSVMYPSYRCISYAEFTDFVCSFVGPVV